MTLRFTILGCGSSSGVPRAGLGWGACDPENPKNRRRRCSLLVERIDARGGKTTVLVDTSPDLREQLLDADVNDIDGVLFTHEHADHTHGIDDLRSLFIHRRRPIDVWMDEPTAHTMRVRFGYCFASAPGSDYPPIVTGHRLVAGQPVIVDGAGGAITALPFAQDHGDIVSLGFRFANVAYSADLAGLPDVSIAALAGLDLWMVDALRIRPHPSHFSLSDALAWIGRIAPRRAILINLHADLDYGTLERDLPAHIRPAYDGMRIGFSTSELNLSDASQISGKT